MGIKLKGVRIKVKIVVKMSLGPTFTFRKYKILFFGGRVNKDYEVQQAETQVELHSFTFITIYLYSF
jgi:hypothetical protein